SHTAAPALYTLPYTTLFRSSRVHPSCADSKVLLSRSRASCGVSVPTSQTVRVPVSAGSPPEPPFEPPSFEHPASASPAIPRRARSEEHTSELQSRENLVCRL